MTQFNQEQVNWVNQQVAAGVDAKQAVDTLCAHMQIAATTELYTQCGVVAAQPAAPAATTPTGTPSTLEVTQQALPAGFNLMDTLTGRLPSEKSASRPKNYEVSIEELRSRVTFRDGQPVGKKDETVVWLRAYLAPNTVAVEEVNGLQADGTPNNHWVVAAQYEEAAKAQLMQLFASGTYDKQLLDVAEQQKAKDAEKAAAPTKAPVDQAAADAALSELTSAAPMAQVQTQLPAQTAQTATIPSMPGNAPTGLPQGMPSGMPSGIPGL